MARTLGADGADGANEIRKEDAEKWFSKLDAIHDKMDSAMGEFRSDIKDLYGKAADKMGLTRKVLAHEFARRRKEAKRLKKEASFEDSEKLSLEQLRNALGPLADLPLGLAAQGETDQDGTGQDHGEAPH